VSSILAIRHVIHALAALFHVDPRLALAIARRESAFNPNAIGNDGKAVGLWQWHLPSWIHVRRHMNLPSDDCRLDIAKSTQTAMFAMGILHLYHWWSTYPDALDELTTTPSPRPLAGLGENHDPDLTR